MSEDALRQAEAEGLALLKAENNTGYKGVNINSSSKAKPYTAQVWRGEKNVSLGCFAAAEEAALRYARTPEGRAAVAAAAADQPPMRAKKRAFIESFFRGYEGWGYEG